MTEKNKNLQSTSMTLFKNTNHEIWIHHLQENFKVSQQVKQTGVSEKLHDNRVSGTTRKGETDE